jgi:cytochrome P450
MQGLTTEIEQVRKAKDDPEGKTIFHELLRSDMPQHEKETERLVDEAMVLTIAGSDTTASTLAALTCRVLSDEAIFRRLRDELDSVMPDPDQPPEPAKLDVLPYLNALIEESLRYYPSATHRQDRVATDEDMVYEYPGGGRSVLIPRGTPVGMTARIVNRHPALYGEDAEAFRPERFIENPRLMRKGLTFSKGGRQCLGMNLAYQELQTFTAGIFRKYSVFDPDASVQKGPTLELCETTLEDVEIYADFVTPGYRPESKGVRVKVRRE